MPAPAKRKRLTKTVVDSLKPGDTAWDADVPGFAARRRERAVFYAFKYRVGGKQRWATIGRHGAAWTVETARAEARKISGLVASGKDPQAEKQAGRTETVAAAIKLFLERHASQLRSGAEVRRVLEREVLPQWGDRRVNDIARRDVIALLDAITDRGSPVMATRTLAHIRKLFAWCIERDLILSNPAAGAKGTTPPARDRVLTDAELAAVYRACDQLGWPFGPCIKILILTAQRRDEVASMRWRDIDLERATWTIPGEVAKNGKPHEVPLSASARTILGTISRLQNSEFVFTTTGKSAISGFSKPKKRLHELVERELAGAVANWRIHDLRRTAASGMARLGYGPHVLAAVLNHSPASVQGITAVYNRYRYEDEKRRALSDWAESVDNSAFRVYIGQYNKEIARRS